MPQVPFTPSNPHTTTRSAFTANILSIPIPSNADPLWAATVRHQQGLYSSLFYHSAMSPNQQQTFMTPAASKSSIYHTWDFVGRTLQFLYLCDYSKDMRQRRGQDKKIWDDALGRVYMSRMLVEDTSGKSEMMVQSNVDVRVEFDEGIKRAARDMEAILDPTQEIAA